MPEAFRVRLQQMINRLKPADLLNQTRAIVLNRLSGDWDYMDGEDDEGDAIRSWEKANKMAQEVGRLLANDATVRTQFIAELIVAPQQERAIECGRGLAEGAVDLGAMWCELVTAFGVAEPKTRNPTVIGGFLHEANNRDNTFVSQVLESTIDNPDLAPHLPFFQARISIDDVGIARLRRAIAKGVLLAHNFHRIANGVVSNSPPEPLGELLEDIAKLSGGVEVALEILHMHFYRYREEGRVLNARLVEVGRSLLARADFSKKGMLRDFSTGGLIDICLAGADGQSVAERVCTNIRSAQESVYIPAHDLSHVLHALFETQPFVALDTFLLPTPSPRSYRMFDTRFGTKTPIDAIDPTILQQWADRDPAARYSILGECITMFDEQDSKKENDLSPRYLSLLDYAPEKQLFLKGARLLPSGWSGSLADILIHRRAQLMKLVTHTDNDVRAWVTEIIPKIDRWIELEQGGDRQAEESFE